MGWHKNSCDCLMDFTDFYRVLKRLYFPCGSMMGDTLRTCSRSVTSARQPRRTERRKRSIYEICEHSEHRPPHSQRRLDIRTKIFLQPSFKWRRLCYRQSTLQNCLLYPHALLMPFLHYLAPTRPFTMKERSIGFLRSPSSLYRALLKCPSL